MLKSGVKGSKGDSFASQATAIYSDFQWKQSNYCHPRALFTVSCGEHCPAIAAITTPSLMCGSINSANTNIFSDREVSVFWISYLVKTTGKKTFSHYSIKDIVYV